MIGLVLLRSQFYGFGLGIRYTCAKFHCFGVRPDIKQTQMILYRNLLASGPIFFKSLLDTFEGPEALSLGKCLIMRNHSSYVSTFKR